MTLLGPMDISHERAHPQAMQKFAYPAGAATQDTRTGVVQTDLAKTACSQCTLQRQTHVAMTADQSVHVDCCIPDVGCRCHAGTGLCIEVMSTFTEDSAPFGTWLSRGVH